MKQNKNELKPRDNQADDSRFVKMENSEVSKINSFKIKSVKLLYFSSVPIVLCLLYLCPLFFFLEFYSCFSHLSFTLTHWSLWIINEIDEKDVL